MRCGKGGGGGGRQDDEEEEVVVGEHVCIMLLEKG